MNRHRQTDERTELRWLRSVTAVPAVMRNKLHQSFTTAHYYKKTMQHKIYMLAY